MFGVWVAGVAVAASGQTHVVKKGGPVLRALGVYEWTGEIDKPKASRLVPVSVFLDGQMEDAGVYLARPVPLALQTGTLFEVDKAGVPEGTLEMVYSRHLEVAGRGDMADGWLGYGAFKANPVEKPAVLARKSGELPKVLVNGKEQTDGPKLGDRTDTRPPARIDHTGGATETATAGTGSNTDDDPERPTLRRRNDTQRKAAQKAADQASVTELGSLNDDPDRPNLHRGKPVTRMDEDDIPPLHGIPADMQQRVAVSDAVDRPEHEFARAWADDAERRSVLGKMQELARAQVARYAGARAVSAVAPHIAAPRIAGAKRAVRAPGKILAGATGAFSEERLEGYTLSYGGAPTYFYSASSPGPDGSTRYVAVVAQDEASSGMKVALASVTDSAHLDRVPQMRLVDAVDAEASNRASLLLELRGEKTRQFALYRVIGAEAEQRFATGRPE